MYLIKSKKIYILYRLILIYFSNPIIFLSTKIVDDIMCLFMDERVVIWEQNKKTLRFMCVKKTWFTESVVKISHDLLKLFKQPILKTYQIINLLNILKQTFICFICFNTFTKLFDVFKIGCWNNFQKPWLVLTTDSVNLVFFLHMKRKKTYFILTL